MKQEIRFKGLTLDRDELATQNGELALCGGVELHDDALRPSVLDGTLLGGPNELLDGESGLLGTLVYVHIYASYKHYITVNNGLLYWAKESVDANTDEKIWEQKQIEGISSLSANDLSVSAINNTLCILAESGIHYILFKDDDYKYLGQQPPFLELQFNMKRVNNDDCHTTADIDFPNFGGGFIYDDHGGDWIAYDQSQSGTGGWRIREDYQAPITDAVMAVGNKLIRDASDKGLFHSPFLIRYCYRMVDGKSFILHSPPVLLMPAQSEEITAKVRDFSRYANFTTLYKNFNTKFKCDIEILTAKLQARCLNTQTITALAEWKDVIRSVDIFISPQITRIDSASVINFIDNGYTAKLGKGLFDGSYDTYNSREESTHEGDYIYHQGTLQLPKCTNAEYYEKVRRTATFFKMASYNLENLQTIFGLTFTDVALENNIITNVTTQEQMTDDYKTHNLLVPIKPGSGGTFVYNHRLNVYGISERLFEGFSPGVMFPYMDSQTNISKVIVTLNTEDGPKKVEKTCNVPYITDALKDYAFYPDARATGITFVVDGVSESIWPKYKLNEHLFLNGGFYAFGIWTLLDINDGSDLVPMPNKIYVSRTDNPFYFPNLVGEAGIEEIGTGSILGAGILTRALSAGQVGDHSLAVFATDGIWVMKVSEKGTYSEKHNISNEVCVNPKSVCQLGQSIVFATERSLSRFFESDVLPISDVLVGPIRNFSSMLPDFYNRFAPGSPDANPDIIKLLDFGVPAINYFRSGRVVYDYESKRLLILPAVLSASESNVLLVFSIDNQAWSTMVIPPTRTLMGGYPNPYYQDADGRVSILDVPYPQTNTTPSTADGVIITRTLAFSETMDVIQDFQQLCDCATMPLMYFYGSNDQRTWQLIGYSNKSYSNYMPGYPFRYFRIAMYISMAKTERYQELILGVINKYAKL